MDKLLTVLHHDFPEFEAQKMFHAAIPVYAVRLTMEIIEPHKLTTFQAYLLQALSLGVNTQHELAHLFGVLDRDLLSPCASLLKLGYIEQKLLPSLNDRQITLTERGRQALQDNGPPPIPKRRSRKIHFNALTWRPIPLEEQTCFADQMMKEGYFILPHKRNGRPSLGDFTLKEVASALKGSANFQESTLIALLELKQAELQYIAPVTVVLLRHPQTEEQRLAVYRNTIQQHQESIEIQRLFDEQQFVLPAEAVSFQEPVPDIPSSFPPIVAHLAETLGTTEYALQELNVQIKELKEQYNATKDEQQKQIVNAKIQEAQEKLRMKNQKCEELQKQLQEHFVEFVRTKQHRPILEEALRHAKDEVLIISPWMNRRACDEQICRLIGEAVGRGVRVRIGYGRGKTDDPAETARNRSNIQSVKNALRQYLPKSSGNLLEMREIARTDRTLLVFDRIFAILGRFNWLSYHGQIEKEYRNETGVLFRLPDHVQELAQIALQELQD